MKDYHPPGTAPGTLEAPSGEGANTAIHLLEYRGEQINVLTIQDLPQLARELADGQPHAAVAWVHVIGLGDITVLQGLADLLKLHPLAMEDVTHLGQRPKVESYDDIVFAILQYPSLVQREIKLAQIALFVGKNFVISFQPSGPDLLTPLRTRILATHARIRERNADYLAYAIIDLIVDSTFPVLEEMGEQLDALEDEIINRPNGKIINTIYQMRRQLLGLRRVLWPQREVLGRLIHEDQDLFCAEVKIYLRDSSDHAVEAMDVVESYREMAASMLDVHLSNTTNRLTDVMRVLTVIATLFTPPTFIASLYGMNFDRSSPWNMPELGWRFGYLFVWGIIIVMIAGMLIFFRRKRWL
ncbi:MAG: magnesium/cobalt transporter CorA [Gammaproteobacteria bacterium]